MTGGTFWSRLLWSCSVTSSCNEPMELGRVCGWSRRGNTGQKQRDLRKRPPGAMVEYEISCDARDACLNLVPGCREHPELRKLSHCWWQRRDSVRVDSEKLELRKLAKLAREF